MMRLIFASILLLLISIAAPAQDQREVRIADDVTVREIQPGVWLHVTTGNWKGQPVPSNGLIVCGSKNSVMIDTAWTEEQTTKLLDWAEKELHRPVRYLAVTHAHEDRIGGIKAAQARKVATYSLDLTMARAKAAGFAPPQHILPRCGSFNAGGLRMKIFFPGHCHAPDNIVVWLPDRQLLFAGCVAKENSSRSIGNLGDADLKQWQTGMKMLIARFSTAKTVIPGHGAIGGPELLTHTLDLVQAALLPKKVE